RLDIGLIRDGRLPADDMSTFSGAVANAARLPIVIDDDSQKSASSLRSGVRRAVRRLRKDHPDIHLGLVVVDYLQLMKGDKRQRSVEEDVSESSEACRLLAKEYNCPVLALSQLNRAVESRPDKRPVLSDLRSSGAIEQDAVGIFFLYREDKYRKRGEPLDGRAEIIIGKHRQGGEEGTVECAFHGPSTAFFNLNNSASTNSWLDDL